MNNYWRKGLMASKELDSIIKQLNSQGKMAFVKGATEEQIYEFEKKNNISLPTQYKEWLKYSDGGEFFLPAGIQLYGVAHKPLINVNDDDRPNENYIVIGAFSFGDPILCERSGEKIFIYNHEAENEADRIAKDETYSDFFSFIRDLYTMLWGES